ncbi:hypothetical protein NNC19_07180 [Clostridium sp. SHJSY1]|uniref:hypothetical protein n=1 Tax=Clostridium sp. SHJSY1 TaxID=2942483 RepID=UPI002874A4F9|nr:hypothetical protein [Clostridium sp. SHJSY1]MDS0525456.1 hypothetical protein [Clostridium sp. SHJSY1]
MDIEDSLGIMIEIVNQKNEDRIYKGYLVNCIRSEEQISYFEYKERLGVSKKHEKKVNIEHVRNEANDALEEFKKAMKGGDN